MTTQVPAYFQPAAVPLFALVASALCVLLLDLGRATRRTMAALSLTGLTVAAAMAVIIVTSGQGTPIQGMLSLDGRSALFVLFFCVVGAACLLMEQGLPGSFGMQSGSGYALLLFATAGSSIAAQSSHWLSTMIGLAILHICLAALMGPQAMWPYVLVQGFAQALMLFGAIVVYGTGGTLHISPSVNAMAAAPPGTANPLTALGTGLLIAGVCVSMVVVPFHTWLRRICRRVWLPAGPLLCVLLSAAAVAALIRIRHLWAPLSDLLALLGSASIIAGYIDALRSRSLRPVLAGIAVAQSGSLLLAWTATAGSDEIAAYYLMISGALAMVCLWALTALLQLEPDGDLMLEDLAGLGRYRPWVSAAATLSLLSLSALPPLAGSIGLVASLSLAVTGYGWAIGVALIGIFLAWILTGRWMWITWMQPPASRRQMNTAPELALLAAISAGGLVFIGICAEVAMRWITGLFASV